MLCLQFVMKRAALQEGHYEGAQPKSTASSTVWANGANGQLLTHSNHLGSHLDGEIHFFTLGKNIASLDLNDFLCGPAAVVDLSDATGDKYQLMHIEQRPDQEASGAAFSPCHSRMNCFIGREYDTASRRIYQGSHPLATHPIPMRLFVPQP
jgi:hypothetical protein